MSSTTNLDDLPAMAEAINDAADVVSGAVKDLVHFKAVLADAEGDVERGHRALRAAKENLQKARDAYTVRLDGLADL